MKKVSLSIITLVLLANAASVLAFKKAVGPAATTKTVTTTPPQGGGQQPAPKPQGGGQQQAPVAGMDQATRQALTDAVNAMKAVKAAAQTQGGAIATQVSNELKAAA